jgi:hypothetical protein
VSALGKHISRLIARREKLARLSAAERQVKPVVAVWK